jgi:hypothetical protein
MYYEVVIMFTDEDKQNIVCVLKPVVKRMIKEVVMSCLVELCKESHFSTESPECTSSPDGIEQVRKRVDMIERAIGIGFIKQFKQPPITDDTLTDCPMRILQLKV